jgi:hypothetical protein
MIFLSAPISVTPDHTWSLPIRKMSEI